MADQEVRMKGKVSQVIRSKGYFFVLGEDGLSRFVHASSLRTRMDFDLLKVDQEVEFTPTTRDGNPDKLRGVDVEVI